MTKILTGDWYEQDPQSGRFLINGTMDVSSIDDIREGTIELKQLADTSFMRTGINSTSLPAVVEGNTLTFTTNTTYGHAGLTVPNTEGDKYHVVTTVMNMGMVNATNVRLMVGYGGLVPGGSAVIVNGVVVYSHGSLLPGASFTWEGDVVSATAQTGIMIGATTGVTGVTLRITQRIYNITKVPPHLLAYIDWASPPPLLFTSDVALKSLEAEHSLTSDKADSTEHATHEFINTPINVANAEVFQATMQSRNADTRALSYTLLTTTGGIGVPVTLRENHNYIIIFKNNQDRVNRVGVMTTAWGWHVNNALVAFSYNGETYKYGIVQVGGSAVRNFIYVTSSAGVLDTTYTIEDIHIIDITGVTVTQALVEYLLETDYSPIPIAKTLRNLDARVPTGKWEGKNVLCIGDSLTASLGWQPTVSRIHRCNITTHAKGGIGIRAMVDGHATAPALPALSASLVADKDLIIFFGGMNERTTDYGVKGDTNTTIWGSMQYVINKIYDLLEASNNLDCKLLIVTPHCAGKYEYIDADGYVEYPTGSGKSLEKLSDTIKAVAQYNNIPVVDLWHDSGIGRRTWGIYSASPTATRTTPATGAPFPNNGDQLHLSALGNARVGEVISGKMDLV